jgi:hypothetical protein
LKSLDYSLQAPVKEKEGTAHPDRDVQFSYLNDRVGVFTKAGEPVISADTKKKELVGEFSNGGRKYHPRSEPRRVKAHDFIDKELGRAVPWGVYDLANGEGRVSVGDTADTASFAVEAVRRWWQSMGRPHFPKATKLLITADAGGRMDIASGCESSDSPSSPKRPGTRSRSGTIRPGRRDGTRLSTRCSASSS